METLRNKEGFICDMDGVIYHGNRLLPGVKEFVNWLTENKKNFLFLTNSSQYTPRELQNKLARMGLDVDETHFYTSALATACFLDTQSPGCSAYVVGEHGILNALYDKGIIMMWIRIMWWWVNPPVIIWSRLRRQFVWSMPEPN